jgi:hypothetical protein
VSEAGDVVTLSISGMDMENVKIGCIICDEGFPIPMATVFLAQAQIFQKFKKKTGMSHGHGFSKVLYMVTFI